MMINVLFRTESHYRVNRPRIREAIIAILEKEGVRVKTEVSISIVGDRYMRMLNKKYKDKDETTNVLSFPLNDEEEKAPFVDFPDKVLRLGDIVISYPEARSEAAEENKLVDEKIDELIEHGLMHLLGKHHE
jgi:probable rRNA maturation factor